MSSNYLALRRSAAPSLTVSTVVTSTITGSRISVSSISTNAITVSTMNLQSTMISLGQSTNQTYNNFSNGSFTTGWASTLTGLTSIKKVVLSPNGSVQTVLQNTGSTMSTVITSLNSGSTWAGSTMKGLPTSGALPYQTYGSTINAMTVPSITAITAAPSGTNQLAIASNELVYASANSGATFAATGLGQNNSPFIYIPFDGSVTDVMGNSAVTATATSGSITYVPGKVGTNAVNLANTAGGTATQYLRGTWTGSNSFTVSFWFNAQTLSGYANLFITANATVSVFINAGNNVLMLYVGGTSINGPVISTNTWYNITAVYQNGGTSSLYVNNAFYASGTGSWNPANITVYGIGAQEIFTAQAAFNGYIDDFRIYNYAVTNPSGAALINPLVGPIMPYVYLTFDGSTTTDVMGNSTTTASGSPGFVTGQIGSNALDLSTNTAGGTATKNISGTWAGTSNFTVSGWFNAQAIPASSVAMIFSAGTGVATAFQVFITPGGVFTVYSSAGYTTSTITTNTWYFFQVVYQSSGTCYVYLNGTQATTFTGTTLSPIPTTFNIGTYTHTAALGAFKGYIDDIRIYNGAFMPSQLSPVLYSPSHAIGLPNIYLPFENGSVLDVMGYSAVSARGTMNFVPGVVGTSALNLMNPAGGTAVNYLRGSWAGSPNFTVSFWFNLQSLGVTYQNMFTSYSSQWAIDISSDRLELWYGSSRIVSSTLSINTWYYAVGTFVANGTGELYLNGTRVGTYSCGATAGTSSGIFGIGTNDVNTVNAGNIYIDDLKIYNCAVPFNAIGPMNYTQAAISNSGAYQVVAAANGGVYTSANSGSTWSQAVTSPQPAPAVNTVGGQVITPQLTGLAAATWTQNGVNWVASASSDNAGSQLPYKVFNNTTGDAWLTNNTIQRYTSTGATNGNTATTSVIGIGTVIGEWIQIQSSVPLVLSSFGLGIGLNVWPTVNAPSTYYMIGSNDGTAWYPLQYGAFTISNFVGSTNQIVINTTGTQTLSGMTGSVTTTSYTTSTQAYMFYRMIGTSIMRYGGQTSSYMEIGEWFINFTTPATPLYVAPSTALIANQSLNAITVMPQQTGLVSSTWTTNGVSWVVSASSSLGGYPAYAAFSNVIGTGWANSSPVYTSTTYSGAFSTTVLGSVGAVTGEWIQIQSSVPVVLSTYSYANSGNTVQQPQTYYIVGSTDGTSWFPIHRCSAMSANPFPLSLSQSNYLSVTSSGSVPFIASVAATGTFETYPTSSNAYTYFRFITRTTYHSAAAYVQIGQIYFNFTAYTPALLQSLSMSPSGQYMALTGAGAVTPNLTGLAANTWTANGVNWVSSQSPNANNSGWLAFNNSYTLGNNWIGQLNQYSSGNYVGSNSTTILGGIGPISGDWVQIQSSVPVILSSYSYAIGNLTLNPKSMYIVGSNDGTNWYPLQLSSLATNPFNTSFTTLSTQIFMNITGSQMITGNTTQSLSTTAYTYTANTFLYFRFIVNTIFLASGTDAAQFGELYLNFQSGPTFYSTDYGSSWTRSLTAATIPNANVLATSGNGQYSLQACGQTVIIANNTAGGNPTGAYTTPTFSPALTVNPVSNAAVSATGQYMVLVTQGTTNNVYYSSNYGVSFTGITLGSTAMVSCAVSADGSYITVASATQVFTLNSNTQGLSITVGNQSGLTNQGQNAVAIGNQAGQTNQSANSIVLNSSGTAVNAYIPGFFVTPVQSAGSSLSGSFAVLGYGTDNQVVQTGVSIRADGTFTGTASFAGNVGFGTTAPIAPLHLYAPASTSWPFILNYSSGPQFVIGNGGASNIIILDTYNTVTGTRPPLCLNSSGGFVGIGMTNPTNILSIYGANPTITTQCNNFYQTTKILLQAYDTNRFSYLSQEETGSFTQILRLGVTNNYGAGIAKQINLETDGVARLIVYPSGVITTHLGPQADNTYDLGWFGNRWRAVWAVNGAVQTSDSNVKDAVPLSYGINEILQMRTIKYKWKNQADLPEDDPTKNFEYYGFCADELAPLFPELVYNEDTTAPVQMNYSEILPVVVNALKEEHASAVALKATVDSQAEQIVSLQTKLDTLMAWAQTQGYSA